MREIGDGDMSAEGSGVGNANEAGTGAELEDAEGAVARG